jgi:EAL domain-containing protein (putative c-di-GMP-specific phosphodiesterase class I)
VHPPEFIGQLERTGAITALDRWVLRTALRQVRSWADTGVAVMVSVNVSATRFSQGDLVDDVRACLEASGVTADTLEIEITESALIDDIAAAQVQIDNLRAMGVRVAVDDFGAGYSSISYLQLLQVDTVKIDRSLVQHVADGPRTVRMVEAMVHLFKGLGLNVVAEGVEDADQYDRLRGAGCDRVQGHYIGRPATAKDTTGLLRSAAW